MGNMLIDSHGLLEAIEIRGTIGAGLQMFPDRTTFRRIEVFIKVAANVLRNSETIDFLEVHAVMYSLSCSRRNTLALRRRDFIAGTESLRIFDTSSADFPSTSRSTKTTR